MEYVSPQEARFIFKVSNSTLRRWDQTGKISTIRTPSGRRLYSNQIYQDAITHCNDAKEAQKICYCRVSSHGQKNDLKRQVESLRSQFPDHTIIQDIGSGINWKRTGLKTILELAMQGKLSEVVVAHRDRLCRFAFELIQWILEQNNVQLVVLDEGIQTSEQELAEDLLSIIHVFSCRQMGKRRYKKKEKIVKEEDNGNQENKISPNT